MNKRRLLKLADLLEADANNKKGIRFAYWSTARISNPEEPVSCGTSACAMGLAAISGAFKRTGIGYRLPERVASEITFTWNGVSVPFEKAAMNLFDLTVREADFLFMPGNTPEVSGAVAERQVAKLIRDFVSGKVGPVAPDDR